MTNSTSNVVNAAGAGQVIQVQNSAPGNSQSTNGIQLVQQIVTPSGEVQHIPVRENSLCYIEKLCFVIKPRFWNLIFRSFYNYRGSSDVNKL